MRYKWTYPSLLCFSLILLATGIVLDDPGNVGPGLWKIMITEDALITDYIAIAGPGAAFVNCAIVTGISVAILWISRDPPNG